MRPSNPHRPGQVQAVSLPSGTDGFFIVCGTSILPAREECKCSICECPARCEHFTPGAQPCFPACFSRECSFGGWCARRIGTLNSRVAESEPDPPIAQPGRIGKIGGRGCVFAAGTKDQLFLIWDFSALPMRAADKGNASVETRFS